MLYPQIDILYYACGGGMGHVNRCAAILRKLKDKRVLAIASTPQIFPLLNENIPYINLAGLNSSDVYKHIRWLVLNYDPKVIIMDTFPHGLVGEMEEILKESNGKKILISRHVKQEVTLAWQEIVNKFNLVISVEKPLQYKYANYEEIEPVLLRDANELLSAVEVRKILSVNNKIPVIAAVSTGDFAWEANFFNLFLDIWLKYKDIFQPILISPNIQEQATYPLIELLPGIDIVIGAAGYNLFYEVKATKRQGIFMPQPKRYDDQHWRARKSPTPQTTEELENMILSTCSQLHNHEIKYINGAIKAAELIRKFI